MLKLRQIINIIFQTSFDFICHHQWKNSNTECQIALKTDVLDDGEAYMHLMLNNTFTFGSSFDGGSVASDFGRWFSISFSLCCQFSAPCCHP